MKWPSQRYGEELFDEIPEADAVIGVNDYDMLPEIIVGFGYGRKLMNAPCTETVLPLHTRKHNGSRHTATLKIAEGCNNRCTYCVIPDIRGPYRSKRIEDILEEARWLAREGCRELILIAQDTTYYGYDLYGEYRLAELLRKLAEIDGIRWIRVMYAYEDRITDELIRTIAEEDKICNYLDIPVQHISDSVLKRMARRSSGDSVRGTIARLRKEIPGIAIRTTFITGFPGETDEDFDELYDFVEEAKLDRVGVFPYSREEDTPAYDMEDQVDEQIKQERADSIMRRQLEISRSRNESLIGTVLEVIVDSIDEDGTYVGRTRYDAPEIDNSVLFTSDREHVPGDITEITITDAFDYDLIGAER